jgi:hypothetical protein
MLEEYKIFNRSKMRNRKNESPIKLLFLIIFFALAIFSCNKKAIENGIRPGKKIAFKEQRYYSNKDNNNALSSVWHSPGYNLDIFSFGKKNEAGDLIKLEKMLFFNPADSTWCYFIIKDKYPNLIHSSNDIFTELNNYNRVERKVDILIKDATEKIIYEKNGYQLREEFFQSFDNSAKYLIQNSARKKANILVTPCEDAKQGIAALGFAANSFNCVLGLATIAESAGILLLFNGLGTAVSCYNVANVIVNGITQKETLPNISCKNSLALDAAGAIGSLASPAGVVTSIGRGLGAAVTASDLGGCIECEPDKDKPDANSSGDPHITTLDGQYFEFQGHGEFIAVKSTNDNFEIQARQEAWIGSKEATVNTGIAIKTAGNDIISVTVDPAEIYINKTKVNLNLGSKTFADGSTFSEIQKGTYRLDTKQGDIVLIDTEFNFLDYTIDLAANREKRVKGIFGNFDGNPTNDLVINNGKLITDTFENKYPAYADSWRIAQNNSLFNYASGKNTATYTIKNFPEKEIEFTEQEIKEATSTCKNAGINTQPYLNNCVFDVAITGDKRFAQSALSLQNQTFIGNIPSGNINSSINYFPKVRLEINAGSQTDLSQLNLISWKTGKVYALKDGAANAANIDAAALVVGGGNYFSIYPMASLKACGSSCGVGDFNEVIENQNWSISRKGTIESKFGINLENTDNPDFVSASKWSTILKAADLAAIHQPLSLDVNNNSNFTTLAESQDADYPNKPYSNSLYRFITQEGKKGAFVISGFGKIEGTEKYFITIDIKIEK